MNTYLAWVMVAVGLLGCGAQELPGGSHDAGREVGRPVIDATGRNLDDAGCPPEGKIACLPVGCSDVFPTPACIHGVWSCPALAECPVDASVGTDGGRDAGAGGDAATRCAWPVIDAGGYFTCGACGSDSTPFPTCLDGAWTCPTATSGPTVCPPMVRRCVGPQPAGCSCSPITGAVYCAHDAGADAPS